MKLQIEQGTYPSGKPYTLLKLGYHTIGSYSHEGNGFLVSGCRKPVATEREAQVKVIRRYINDHLKRARDAAELLEQY
jgi:hypothetical protein